MKWQQAREIATEILKALEAKHDAKAIRSILRALSRIYFKRQSENSNEREKHENQNCRLEHLPLRGL